MMYAGSETTVPVNPDGPQLNPSHAGGVITLQRRTGGDRQPLDTP